MTEVFSRSTRVDAPAAAVFDWHARPGALERLTPPWERIRVLDSHQSLRDGSRVVLEIGRGPARVRWVAEHRNFHPPARFSDVQVSGPFARWEHTHSFEPEGEHASILADHVEYELPAGTAGAFVGGAWVRRHLERTFTYRHRVTRDDLAAHAACRRGAAVKVGMTGAGGLVGSALGPFLTTGGHALTRFVRGPAQDGEVRWDPRAPVLEGDTAGLDAVVHLAGESIAAGRWTAARKARIRASRGPATRHLAQALAALDPPLKVFVCASAVGFYGGRGDERLDEQSPPGEGFLPEVCREWEAAAEPLRERGVRVVHLRFGVVLTPAGGALAKMLPAFRLGAGGRVGSGRQWFSWVALDDVLGAVHHALVQPSIEGPVNVAAPDAVTQAEFARTLGRVLHRPVLAPLPAFAARLAFGEMADALLLSGARVAPARLEAAGYRFRHPSLEGALRHVLGRTA